MNLTDRHIYALLTRNYLIQQNCLFNKFVDWKTFNPTKLLTLLCGFSTRCFVKSTILLTLKNLVNNFVNQKITKSAIYVLVLRYE